MTTTTETTTMTITYTWSLCAITHRSHEAKGVVRVPVENGAQFRPTAVAELLVEDHLRQNVVAVHENARRRRRRQQGHEVRARFNLFRGIRWSTAV